MRFKIDIFDLLIVFLIIAVILSNYLWLKMDEYPAEGHELMGLTPAVQAYKEIKGIETVSRVYDKILGVYYSGLSYGPLSYLIIVLFYFLFGLHGQMVVMVNSLYIAVTLICVYLIGKKIFNARTGLLAAFILSSFPGFIVFSRVYWIEFGLMAYVSLDLYLLLKTNFFENRKYSVLLGVSLALSFLHKYEFIPFVIGPLLLVAYKSMVLKDIFRAKLSNKVINSIFSLAICLVLTSFWWVSYGKGILGRVFFAFFSQGDQEKINKFLYLQNILSFDSLSCYFKSLIFLVGPFFLLLLLTSIVFIIIMMIKRKKLFYILFILLSFIVPYTLYTLFRMKNTSHILSLLASLSILIGWGICFIKNKAAKIALISLIFVHNLTIQLLFFYSFETQCPNFYVRIIEPLTRAISKFTNVSFSFDYARVFCFRQERLELAVNEILEFVRADSYKKAQSNILVVFKRPAFSNRIFEYYSLIKDCPFKFVVFSGEPISGLFECDYIIIERLEGQSVADVISEDCVVRDFEIRNFKRLFSDGVKGFDLIRVYNIPNGNSSALIYKRAGMR